MNARLPRLGTLVLLGALATPRPAQTFPTNDAAIRGIYAVGMDSSRLEAEAHALLLARPRGTAVVAAHDAGRVAPRSEAPAHPADLARGGAHLALVGPCLAEPHPRRLFEVLADCGALARLLPEIRADEALYDSLGRAAREGAPLAQRFALLAWRLDEAAVRALCARLRAPNDASELALAACRCRERIRGAGCAGPDALLETLKRADAIRRAERFAEVLAVARLAEPGEASERAIVRLQTALAAAQGVDAGAIAREALSPAEIPEMLDRAREQAIATALAGR